MTRPAGPRPGSGAGRVWTATACLTATGWAVVAVVQSPRLPLVLLVAGLGAVGGLVLVRTARSPATALSRWRTGALWTAAAVLVTVGIGHHLGLGLAMAALLAATSPAVRRRARGR